MASESSSADTAHTAVSRPSLSVPASDQRRVLGCSRAQWRLVALFLVLSLVPLTGLAVYIRGTMYDLQVRTAVGGLMNFADAKQQGVIRFLGQNEKLATTVAAQVEATGAESIQPLFATLVTTDAFRPEDHPFKEEIVAGTRHIPTWRVYQAVDYVKDDVIQVSSDPRRVGRRWTHPVDLRAGYSEVYLADGQPYLTFGAPARGGMVYLHADALILTDIVSGEIGNLEGKSGAFYLAGVGKTFDYYLVNRDNVMITESRVHPNALLRRQGSALPWERTLHGQHDPACHHGVYTPDGGVPTGCREAMGFYPSTGGQQMLGASMPFYDSQWTIVVEQQADELLAPLTTMQNRIWGILGVIVLAITVLAYLAARRFSLKEASSLQAVHEASHDSLTGLPGRGLFLGQLDQTLATAAPGHEVNVLFIDLAGFKSVNDTLGHAAGDQLLSEVADRIRACLRASDLAARLGGDEFAVLLPGTGGPEIGLQVAERIIDAITRPFLIAGREIFIAASIGVASGHQASHTATELLGNADLAMYRAKKDGSRHPVAFEARTPDGVTERLELPGELQRALVSDQLWVQYQPLLNLSTGAPVGVEALARWTHPTWGVIPPVTFIPVAEETGLIVELGRWVLREACRQLATWRRAGFPDLTVNVNLSGRQLLDDHLAADVEQILADTGVPAAALTLEMTESVLIDDPTRSLRQLRGLKGLGVRLALDDFGTGYSSLSYLRQFPVDELKIDKSFVARLDTGIEDLAIVRTVINLANTLHLRTTAEGIETPAQRDALQQLGCRDGQGYLFTPPLHPDQIPDYLIHQSLDADPGPAAPIEAVIDRDPRTAGA